MKKISFTIVFFILIFFTSINSANEIEISVVDELNFEVYEVFNYSNPNQGPTQWPFNKDFFIILNLAVGGNMGGEIDESNFPQHFNIDYVKVSKRGCSGI